MPCSREFDRHASSVLLARQAHKLSAAVWNEMGETRKRDESAAQWARCNSAAESFGAEVSGDVQMTPPRAAATAATTSSQDSEAVALAALWGLSGDLAF